MEVPTSSECERVMHRPQFLQNRIYLFVGAPGHLLGLSDIIYRMSQYTFIYNARILSTIFMFNINAF